MTGLIEEKWTPAHTTTGALAGLETSVGAS